MGRQARNRLRRLNRRHRLSLGRCLQKGLESRSDCRLKRLENGGRFRRVRNNRPVSNIERKWSGSLFGVADHDQRLAVGDRESEFVPDVWVISCDFGYTGLAVANAVLDGLNQDIRRRITVDAIVVESCVYDCRDNYVLVPFVVSTFVEGLDHKTAAHDLLLNLPK